jgi:hypothetical protein
VTADATQWTDHSSGRNLDESTVVDGFWTGNSALPVSPVKETAVTLPALAAPIIGSVRHRPTGGRWLFAQDGGAFAVGGAPGIESCAGKLGPGRFWRSVEATPTGAGAWVTASDGGIFAYGDADGEHANLTDMVAPSTAPLAA